MSIQVGCQSSTGQRGQHSQHRRRGLRKAGVCAAVLLALLAAATPAAAVALGPVRSIAPVTDSGAAAAWDITTASGERVRVEVLRADLLRVQAGRDGKLLPAGDKAAPIVLPQPLAHVAASLEEDASELRIRTPALLLHIQRSPLQLTLERIEAGKTIPLWHELQPLDLSAQQTVQVPVSYTHLASKPINAI